MAEQTKKDFSEKQLVIFRLCNEEFGVDINEVREIIKIDNITKIPNTENYIEGVINLRGKIIVVINLEKKLDLPKADYTKDTRIIINEVNSTTIGMIVDSCNEVLRINTDKIEPAPAIIRQKISTDFLDGVGILNERLIILLNFTRVLGSSDLNTINDIQKRA